LPVKQKQAPRTGKKAQVAAERANRVAYAQVLFTELNHVVFGDGLPKDTKLNWNKRLLTTAGRAKWHM
jgi:thioester reductase-like protein